MAEGEELPPVVAVLVGDDSSFLEMIARDVEMAEQFKADLEAALGGTGSVDVSADLTGVEDIPAQMAEVGDQAAAAVTEPIVEGLAEVEAHAQQMAEGVAESSQAAGAGLAEGVGRGAAEVGAELEQLQNQIHQLLDQNTAETDAQVQALSGRVGELNAELNAANEADFGGATEGWGEAAGAKAAIQETEQETLALGEVIDDVTSRVQAGLLTAGQAISVLAGEEVRSTSAMNETMAKLTGTWANAQAALEQYGTAEAQLTVTTNTLADAQDELLGTQTNLLMLTRQLAQGSEVDAEIQVNTLEALADAQRGVTSATQAQIAAQTELNLAAIQGDAGFLDETVAFDGMRAASIQLGLGLNEVADQLQEGNYALTSAAAAEAQAALRANLLTEAQQQLAAANLTLVQTYQALDDGLAVSSEAQMAALAGVKSAESDVGALSGGLGKAASGAEEASKGFEGLSSIMYGPLGMALYPLMMALPYLGDLFHSTSVAASVFTGSVTQDSNAIGDNTAATIQTTLAKTNLSTISNQLGVSQAQLIEYAAGETNVQQQLNAAYNQQVAALTKAGDAQSNYASTTTKNHAGTKGPDAQLVNLQQQKQALDAVTTAVAQAVQQDAANSAALLAAEQTTKIYNASVNALGESQLLQVQSTLMSNQATVEYGQQLLTAESSTKYMAAAVGAAGVNMELQAQATEVTNQATVQYGNVVMGAYRDATMFNSAIDASYISMQEQAQTSAISSVGLLNLGDSQSSLNRQLVMSEMSYAQAQQGANAYDSAVTALSGTTNTLLGDEAAFTTALGGVTAAVKLNGTSLNVTNEKGAANVTVMTQIATAADTAAGALYQNEVSTKGATQAYTDANTKLGQEKQAFIEAADKAGMNKNAVKALADELFQLPPSITTEININTSQAQAALNQLQGQLSSALGAESSLNSGSNLQTISAYEHALGAPRKAAGGPVQQGSLYHVNESGAEGFFVPPADGYIVPHEAMAGAVSSGGSSYAGGSGGSGGGSAPQTVVHVYLDSREITATARTEAQQYKNRNSQTGFI